MNFNTISVCKILGLTKRRVDYWDKTHFIKPSIREAAGYGSARLYNFTDLIQLKVAKTLRSKGISLQKIRKAVSYLKKHMPDIEKPLADLKFLTDGDTIFVLTDNSTVIIDTLQQGQIVFSVAIGEFIEELKGEIISLDNLKTYKVNVKGRKFSVKLHADTEDGGYWIECPEIPGCLSQGDTVEEALEMIKDAIDGCLQVLSSKSKGKKAS